jgi:UDP-N-acetylglucosamine acyltransferase
MNTIDPTARVEDGAVIGEGTIVGPYCMIGPHVVIGKNCKLAGHVHVTGHTSIGPGCVISPFAALGGPPQDLSYRGEPTRLEIGAGCTIREGVTMNVGTVKGGGLTRVGDRGFFMNNSHVGHDCMVGNDVIFATSATLGGHCEIADFVYIGGLSAVHQFTRIGPQVMVGGVCGVRGDVIPFGLVNGQYAELEGLNIVGMKRRKFTRERLAGIRAFYLKLFHGPGVFAERLEAVRSMADEDPAIAEILTFIDNGKHRPLCLPAEQREKK